MAIIRLIASEELYKVKGTITFGRVSYLKLIIYDTVGSSLNMCAW